MKSELAEHIDIQFPTKAYQVVESLKELLRRGIIRETAGSCKISDIQSGKPWQSDLIEIEIEIVEIATKFKFKLSIETYHGAGGTFKKVSA